MDGEVNLRNRLLLLYRADSIIDLANALLILSHSRLGCLGAIGIHFGGKECMYPRGVVTRALGRDGRRRRTVLCFFLERRERKAAGAFGEGKRGGAGLEMEMARL